MRGGRLDVVVLALPCTRLGGQHPTPVDVLEVAVGELVVALGVLRLLVVYPQVPLPVLTVAVLLDEPVLLGRRRLVLAPVVPLVEDDTSLRDQLRRVVVASLAQLDCHVLGSFPNWRSGRPVDIHTGLDRPARRRFMFSGPA